MTEKLIIQTHGMTVKDAFPYVQAVIAEGRVSNEGRQYCYHTAFRDGTHVSSFLNEKSDRLVVYRVSE